jgi:hypothetical protein
MADTGFRKFGRWAAAALCAAALSLAHAQPPREAQAAFGPAGGMRMASPASPAPAYFGSPRAYPDSRGGYGAHYRVGASDRTARPAPSGRYGPAWVAPARVGSPGAPLRPVSEVVREVPRPSGNSTYMRSGSIREDIARYNAERGTERPTPRPQSNNVPRPPMPSPYRN